MEDAIPTFIATAFISLAITFVLYLICDVSHKSARRDETGRFHLDFNLPTIVIVIGSCCIGAPFFMILGFLLFESEKVLLAVLVSILALSFFLWICDKLLLQRISWDNENIYLSRPFMPEKIFPIENIVGVHDAESTDIMFIKFKGQGYLILASVMRGFELFVSQLGLNRYK